MIFSFLMAKALPAQSSRLAAFYKPAYLNLV
jgi:hypothetical protein